MPAAPKTKPAPLREVHHSKKYGPLPKIALPGAEQQLSPFIEDAAEIIREAWKAFADKAPHLFRRDILPVIPVPGSKRFIPMKAEHFVSWCERHFFSYKTRFDKEGDPYDEIRPMPKEAARAILESLDFTLSLPPIKRTFPTPVPLIPEEGAPMRLCTPGYDETAGAFVFDADFPADPEYLNPADGLASSGGYYDDRMTLREAVMNLHNLHSRFPFSDWSQPYVPTEESPFHDPEQPEKTIRLSRGLAVQIMSMLAVFAGGCVAPQAARLAFLSNANMQRSGKTLLTKIAIYPLYGKCKLQSWRDSDEDMIKLLDSETLAATTYIFFDNIRSLIASSPLEGFMTTPLWGGRILGGNDTFEAENNALIFLTGNNSALGPDMQERSLIIDLYVETADRQDRGGEEMPREHRIDDVWLSKLENRRMILSSLWCIVRHWEGAGRPRATGKARRGFEEWCEIIGGMVEFAGFGDPLERPTDLENCGDSETEDIRALVEHCSAAVRHRELTFQEIVHICWEKGLIPWCMHGREEYIESIQKNSLKLNDSANSRFGLLLKRSCGERGLIHTFRSPDGKETRHVRFSCRGKGISRRFTFEEINPKP
jgi:hypothetical protein